MLATCLVLILIAAQTQARGLLGTIVRLTPEERGRYGLLGDEEILFEASSNCSKSPPLHVAANNARLCGLYRNMRSCLNMTDTEPVFVGRDCTGNECLTKQSAPATMCLLKSYGVEVDRGNSSRKETCGLQPDDVHWLEPSIAPTSRSGKNGGPSCSASHPNGVEIEVWVDCVNGDPEHRLNIRFVSGWQPGKYNYSCIVSPTCIHRELRSRIICYTNDKQGKVSGQVSEAPVGLNKEQVQLAASQPDSLIRTGIVLQIVALSISILFFTL